MTDSSAMLQGELRSEKERERDVAPVAAVHGRACDDNDHSDLMDDTLVSEYRKIKNEFNDYRQNALKVTPGFIVNNSSNLLGAAHVVTEMSMFKSSLPAGEKLAVYNGNPFTYMYDATKRVFSVTFSKSMPKNFNMNVLKTEYGEGNTLRGIYRFVTDTNLATERAMAEQGVTEVSKLKLSNPWQARTTMFGLAAWGLSTLIPDKKDSPEEIEKMTVLQQTNPLGYIGERLKQAVWVPEWHEHKRQMIGLGYIGVGICSTLGSWRGNGMHGYSFNKGYFMTSMFSLASAIPLLFAQDDEKAYGGFGTLMMGRLFFLPGSISRKFATGEPGAAWYAGATAAFQAENYAQTLVGGAEKKPDGTIVDHQEIMKEAKRRAKEIKSERSVSKLAENADAITEVKDANPSTRIHVGRSEALEHTAPDRSVAHAV